jgi:glycosyltransferase involved in cell wall biosynthesis
MSTATGLISTLTTVRDGGAFLAEALDSLLTQTASNVEVIVVDDGSTDGTPAILERYRRFGVQVHQQPRLGRVEAIRHAAAVARGEFLAVLDADDVAVRDRLDAQRSYLEDHPQVGLVGARAIEFDRLGARVVVCPNGPERVRRALGMFNPFYFSTVMVRRREYDAVGGFQPEDGLLFDFKFLVRVAAHTPVEILPEPLVHHRRHAGQLSASSAWQRSRLAAARTQLWAAAQVGLPAPLWVVPLLGWCYEATPAPLRPVRLNRAAKRVVTALINSSSRVPSATTTNVRETIVMSRSGGL